MTHDHKRHGTTDLFPAMNVAAGEVRRERPSLTGVKSVTHH
jgi:hypothetical protein